MDKRAATEHLWSEFPHTASRIMLSSIPWACAESIMVQVNPDSEMFKIATTAMA